MSAELLLQSCIVFMPSFTFRKCSSISQFDDLAFDMYQDPEVAHIIRLLDQKKQDVVQQEDFEEAKKLKQAIADLQKVDPKRPKNRLPSLYIECKRYS